MTSTVNVTAIALMVSGGSVPRVGSGQVQGVGSAGGTRPHSKGLRIYTTNVRESGKRRQWRQALQLFHSMQRKRVLSDVYVYTALISPCAKGMQPAQALEELQAMHQQGVVPNDITHSTLVTARA